MANEMQLFRDSTALINPVNELDEVTKRLLGHNNYRRLSIRGGKFRLIVNGQQTAVSNEPSMDIVVVNAAPHVGRAFYLKSYDPNATDSPDCWSNDGLTPDAKARLPQARSCAVCPKNIAGSGKGNSRACRYLRRLAVVLANNIADSDVYQLQLPSTSLFGKGPSNAMSLDAYVKQLDGYRRAITGVVTEMRFDPDSESPKLYFRAVRPLEDDERAAVAAHMNSSAAEAAIIFDPAVLDKGGENKEPAPQAEASLFREAVTERPEGIAEPTVRGRKAQPEPTNEKAEDVMSAWGEDD